MRSPAPRRDRYGWCFEPFPPRPNMCLKCGYSAAMPQVRGQYAEVLGPALGADDSMRAWASRYARLVFERCDRNKRQASRILNISYHTLDAYLRYGIARSRPPGKRVPAWARTTDPSERPKQSRDVSRVPNRRRKSPMPSESDGFHDTM